MATSHRTAVDAVIILDSLAKILRVTPHGDRQDSDLHAAYVQDSLEAVIRQAHLSSEEVQNARAWGGSEWTSALLYALFPHEDRMKLHDKMRQNTKRAN